MDTITHALAGTAVSDCWFRKRLGPAATPFALIVSALPDIDVVTYFIAPEHAWANHRGYTHSLFPMAVAAPILGGAALLLTRNSARRRGESAGKAEWGWWTLLALLCLYLHTVFDLITSWGTMPLLPFSNARISWDMAPILDIFLTSLLLASFVANRLLRYEKVDEFVNPLKYPVVHTHPKRRKAADWLARVAVFLTIAYLLVGFAQNRQTVNAAREALAEAGTRVVEVRALPVMFTYLAWEVVARDADGNIYNAVHSSYNPKPFAFTVHASDNGPEAKRALATKDGRLFAWYSQNMFVADSRMGSDGLAAVKLSDRRFLTLSQRGLPRFIMEFTEKRTGEFSVQPTQMGFRGVDVWKELELLWELTRDGEISPDA